MKGVKELLDRIRWDPAFGRGEFVLGYEDHLTGGVVTIPLRQVRAGAGDSFSFTFVGDRGEEVSVPYHRVREVYKDGVLIWHRTTEGHRP